MASFGSPTFVSETKIQSSAIHLRNNGYSRRRPRFPFFANLPRKNLGPNPFEAVRAIGKGSEGSDESEDALQATIDKSKKVLAMQRGLLQQIEERKKLISSIKGSTADSGDEQEEASSLTDDASAIRDQNGSVPSSLSRQSTSEKEPLRRWDDVISTPSSSATSIESKPEKEPSKKTASSQVDPRRPLKNTTFSKSPIPSGAERKSANDLFKKKEPQKMKSTKSDALPAFLTTPKDEKKTNSGDQSLAVDLKGEEAKPPPLAGANVMNIIIVAAECAPWSKTGGLGDVAGALPKALARRGHRVMVVTPRYGNYAEAQDSGVRRKYKVGDEDCEVAYYQTFIDGVDFVFIDNQMFRNAEHNVYGGHRVDILRRMVLFCKAAVEVPWHIPCGGVCYGDGNLGFIANDWHTALLPVYLKAYYRDNGLMQYTRSTLVIHNIAHQGRGPVNDFSFVDLPHHYLNLFRHYDPVGGEHFNIFAAGLKTSDRILTVSHGYAWELKTPEGGWGLHGIINDNNWKLRGIVNGIDTEEWSPELDVHLTAADGYENYSLETVGTGKPKCKEALQRELGLPVRSDVPLVGFIGRLDQQKGVDLIAEAIPWMVDQDVQLVMLGTGRPDLEQMLRDYEGRHRDKVRGWVGFSVKTAHRITAGVDVLLMPSRFEPCGLNQLYAMRYGTVPVVHGVGGLKDTVEPFDPYEESGVGWTFDSAETGKLIHALGNCLLTYREYKQSWKGLQRRGMTRDLSWDKAAQSYEEVLVAAKYQW